MTPYEKARQEFEDAFRAVALLRSQNAVDLALEKRRAMLTLQPPPVPRTRPEEPQTLRDALHGDVETREILTEIGVLLPRRSLR